MLLTLNRLHFSWSYWLPKFLLLPYTCNGIKDAFLKASTKTTWPWNRRIKNQAKRGNPTTSWHHEAKTERWVFEEAETQENREHKLFHQDEVTPVKVALKPIKSASMPMEGGLPGFQAMSLTRQLSIFKASTLWAKRNSAVIQVSPGHQNIWISQRNQEGFPYDIKISTICSLYVFSSKVYL